VYSTTELDEDSTGASTTGGAASEVELEVKEELVVEGRRVDGAPVLQMEAGYSVVSVTVERGVPNWLT